MSFFMPITTSGARDSMRSWTTRGVETGPQSEVVMTESAPTLLIEKLVPAPPRVVFDAWLDAEALRRFMCPAPGSSVSHVECDTEWAASS